MLQLALDFELFAVLRLRIELVTGLIKRYYVPIVVHVKLRSHHRATFWH